MEPTRNTTYAGACDCHVHIYEDRYPVVPNVAWKPRHSPVAAYRAEVQDLIGTERTIVVQPTGYGFDNRCTIDAVAQLGAASRGIVLIAADTPDAEILELHAAGMRGVRFMMLGGPFSWDALEPLAARLAPFGWMINLQLDGRDLPAHEEMLKRLPCKVVIDHNGKFLEPVKPDHPAFQSLLRILDAGLAWVKLSAPYETSKTGAPDYDDVGVLARTLAENFPERCLWASNWPHPARDPVPPVVPLYDLLFSWAPGDDARRKILVSNPAELYGF